MTNLSNLIEDIYKTLENCSGVSDDQVDALSKQLSEVLKRRLSETPRSNRVIGISSIGKPARQLWFIVHSDIDEKVSGKDRLKFIYGDIIETILLWLAEISGHSVKDRQREINIDGIIGHQDAEIDGEVVDVKSASSRSYLKFKEGTIINNDPFGYIPQLNCYAFARKSDNPAFLAMDKVTGDLCLYFIDNEFNTFNVEEFIKDRKEMLNRDTPPEDKCYSDIEEENGNRRLSSNCTYCKFKFKCWNNLRAFKYSNGIKYLTKVIKEPTVKEITNDLSEN
jgi:hypothetical protein